MSYWSRSFPGLAENLAEVRQFTQMVLGDAPGADLVVLAVSELAGNAIVHTASGAPGGQFVVHLAAFADRWQVRVDDEGSPTEPHVVVDGIDVEGIDEDADWDCESGRGLAMVSAISRKWGVLGDGCARAVWAEIPYPVQTTGIDAVMSGGMLDALESVARALDAEDDPSCQGVPSPPQVPAARWPGRVPFDPARAERFRKQASHAAFMRALAENAYAETLGPRPLPFWPPFPNPLALQGSSPGGGGR
ncbi:anti-sigma regulatory factor (Ser/Thr protein kinase) [Catenulispora sp. GAS73]|uniref:ATP-binding protein n=1 Tax=Catenulispora sp. GAS73 TaxID=3156269 RepID=UPI003513CBC5